MIITKKHILNVIKTQVFKHQNADTCVVGKILKLDTVLSWTWNFYTAHPHIKVCSGKFGAKPKTGPEFLGYLSNRFETWSKSEKYSKATIKKKLYKLVQDEFPVKLEVYL